MISKDLSIRQLFDAESSTYTYLICDPQARKAALIDPVLSQMDRDLKLIGELGLELALVLDTHVHADHFSASGAIREKLKIKTACSREAGLQCADLALEDGQVLSLGILDITCIATPGHTRACMSYKFEETIMTGDALLIRGTGRTDFQGGSSSVLYHSIREKLFKLPPETVVLPGHDYRGFTTSTIGEEKLHNPRVRDGVSLEQFSKIMSELKLAHPKMMDQAVPANMQCGKELKS